MNRKQRRAERKQIVRTMAENGQGAAYHGNLGLALQAQGKVEQAVASFRRALALRPDFAEMHASLGRALTTVGLLDLAEASYRRAIDLSPGRASFYYGLAEVIRFTAVDRHFARMQDLAQRIVRLPAEDQVYLQFALGKAYGDLGEHERSFHHFLVGNARKRRLTSYDEAATLKRFGLVRAGFTAERMIFAVGQPVDGPIFILGMPRSGTTLVEQILASHPQVYGAGELDLFGHAVKDFAPRGAVFDAGLSAEDFGRLGAGYLHRLRAVAPGATRITDKMPQNFLFCGLISMALPNARIIHVRRDPVDTCLSCFSTLFADGHPYTYDLGELGRYYRCYRVLTDHWRQVLPSSVLLEVHYEDVVADLEGQARRMLAHCGLAWDDACLAFYKTKRPVRTASAAQVRQPIYRTSAGRWRPPPDLLKPLTDEL
jgi:tetratricopeptide (TPR) repeat protein